MIRRKVSFCFEPVNKNVVVMFNSTLFFDKLICSTDGQKNVVFQRTNKYLIIEQLFDLYADEPDTEKEIKAWLKSTLKEIGLKMTKFKFEETIS